MTVWIGHPFAKAALFAGLVCNPNFVSGDRADEVVAFGKICHAQSDAATTRAFQGIGIVEDIQLSSGAVTLDHDEVKVLMPAMVMLYRVQTPEISKGLRTGDRIEFTIDAATYTVLNARVIANSRSRP